MAGKSYEGVGIFPDREQKKLGDALSGLVDVDKETLEIFLKSQNNSELLIGYLKDMSEMYLKSLEIMKDLKLEVELLKAQIKDLKAKQRDNNF